LEISSLVPLPATPIFRNQIERDEANFFALDERTGKVLVGLIGAMNRGRRIEGENDESRAA